VTSKRVPSRGFGRDVGLNGGTRRDQRLGACFDLVLSRGPRLFWPLTMYRSGAGALPYRSRFTFHRYLPDAHLVETSHRCPSGIALRMLETVGALYESSFV
jgi:hypothetical protein